MTDGTWVIREAYPSAPSLRIKQALVLANELDTRDVLVVRDEAEGKEILRRLLGTHGPYATEENPPEVVGGELRLKKPERGLLWLIGSAAFAVRFDKVWPVLDLSDDDEAKN